MKSIKVILSSVAVLAVVGGALAFKAVNKDNSVTVCTAPTETTCATENIRKTAILSGQTNFYFTVKPAGVACNTLECDTPATELQD